MRIKETARMVAAAIVMAALAGCTGQEASQDQECRGDECPPGGTGRGPGGDLPLPNATIPMIQLQGCRIHVMLLALELAKVRPLVPDAFEILPAILPNTAAVQPILYSCDRTLDERSVFGPARLLMVMVFVEPANASWTDSNMANNYVLHAATDSSPFLETLTNRSVATEHASFESIVTPGLGGSQVEHWAVHATSAEYVVDIPAITILPQQAGQEAHFWRGEGPFYRDLAVDAAQSRGHPLVGNIIATGGSPLSSALSTPVTPGISGTMNEYSLILQYDSVWGT